MEEEKKETMQQKMKIDIENKIKEITKNGIQQANIDYLYKLIDIHKDLSNEEYWKLKEENMMYRGYNNYGMDNYETYSNYGGGRRRDSRGRYMEGGNSQYGRRYRGHDMIDDMSENYGRYMENRDNGRYGSPETEKTFDYMLQSAEEFFDHLFKESDSPEQVEKIKRTARKISEKRI